MAGTRCGNDIRTNRSGWNELPGRFFSVAGSGGRRECGMGGRLKDGCGCGIMLCNYKADVGRC